jgi:hypothetical protein
MVCNKYNEDDRTNLRISTCTRSPEKEKNSFTSLCAAFSDKLLTMTVLSVVVFKQKNSIKGTINTPSDRQYILG